jgi:hypothetical protein
MDAALRAAPTSVGGACDAGTGGAGREQRKATRA